MTKSRTRIFLAWASLLSYLLLGAAPAQGLVLCIETDGAINVEAGLNGSCDTRRASARGASPRPVTLGDANTADSHCSSCLDIPFPQISFGSQVLLIDTEVKTPQVSSLVVLFVCAAQHEPATNLIAPAPQTLPTATSLVALRTVILLI